MVTWSSKHMIRSKIERSPWDRERICFPGTSASTSFWHLRSRNRVAFPPQNHPWHLSKDAEPLFCEALSICCHCFISEKSSRCYGKADSFPPFSSRSHVTSIPGHHAAAAEGHRVRWVCSLSSSLSGKSGGPRSHELTLLASGGDSSTVRSLRIISAAQSDRFGAVRLPSLNSAPDSSKRGPTGQGMWSHQNYQDPEGPLGSHVWAALGWEICLCVAMRKLEGTEMLKAVGVSCHTGAPLWFLPTASQCRLSIKQSINHKLAFLSMDEMHLSPSFLKTFDVTFFSQL